MHADSKLSMYTAEQFGTLGTYGCDRHYDTMH